MDQNNMSVLPASVPLHEHEGEGVNAQTDWNVMTLKQYVDSENRNMYAQREAVTERIEVELTTIHREIEYRENSSQMAIDKAITQVTLQNENLRRDAEQRAAAVLDAVNTLAKANESRFAKQEQLIGAVATLEVQLEATRREAGIINTSNQLAIDKAEAANEKRFTAANGLKDLIIDMGTKSMPRELAESKISEATGALAGRIEANAKGLAELQSWRDTQAGKDKGASASIGLIIAGVATLGTLLTMIVTIIVLINMLP